MDLRSSGIIAPSAPNSITDSCFAPLVISSSEPSASSCENVDLGLLPNEIPGADFSLVLFVRESEKPFMATLGVGDFEEWSGIDKYISRVSGHFDVRCADSGAAPLNNFGSLENRMQLEASSSVGNKAAD